MFENLFDGLPLYVRVLLQLIDYCLKAAANWRDTPEGAKEWSDFIDLYESSLNADAGQNTTVEPISQSRATASERKASVNARSRKRAQSQVLPDDFDYSARE